MRFDDITCEFGVCMLLDTLLLCNILDKVVIFFLVIYMNLMCFMCNKATR